MPRLSADPIVITVAEEPALNRFVRAHGTPQKLIAQPDVWKFLSWP